MRPMRHLDDEHMQFYEWSGAGTGMRHALPAGSKRSHPWHASYGVLAVLTTLLVMGCGARETAARNDTARRPAPASPVSPTANEADRDEAGRGSAPTREATRMA